MDSPSDLSFNRGLIEDPAAFAAERSAKAWLYLCGTEFAQMDGGMSYDQVQAAVPEAKNVVSDPPVEMTMDLAREQVAALDQLPRPALVTCRTGPRSSALVYLYAGLKEGAPASEVLERAREDGAPFAGNEALEAWVTRGLEELASSPKADARIRTARRAGAQGPAPRCRSIGPCAAAPSSSASRSPSRPRRRR
jgi:hypothetical protein